MRSWLLALIVLTGCSDRIETLAQAQEAYGNNRVAEAEAAFARLAADTRLSTEDRAQALLGTAHIAWLIDGDGAKATRALEGSLALHPEQCRAHMLRNRILLGTGRAQALLEGADPVPPGCHDRDARETLALDAADAALALGPPGGDRAAAWLKKAGTDARNGLRGAALVMELGLSRDDPVTAQQGWRDYFWLTNTDAPAGLGLPAGRAGALFAAGAAPGATIDARLALAELLVRAGFARAAERFAARHAFARTAAGDPRWRKIAAYLAQRARLTALVLASNRRVARGGKADDLAAAVRAAQDALMAAAHLSGDRAVALRRAYGLYGTVGDTGGFASVHLGHIVQDERRAVEQYGHRADVGFIVIDNMISNGYESWLWDGSAAAGGWTDPGPVIVQIRPEYTSGPLDAWRVATDPDRRAEVTGRQAARAAADRAALADGKPAYLAGLADRLRLQLIGQIMSRARATTAAGGDLRRAFLDEYWRANVQQAIFVHEGRHALDRTLVTGMARLFDGNLEYRAKLSEMALADYPRLALYNIDAPTVGGDTAHGVANTRVLQGYDDWIAQHHDRVRGFDPATPPLAQLDRLTDAQLRAVARSLDPIAR